MRHYSYAVETRVEDATRILTHYFKGSANDNEDMRAEMRTVVESILEATSIYTEEEIDRAAQKRSGELMTARVAP